MSRHARFIYRIVSIGIALLCLLSCAPKPEIEWVPEIKSVSAKVTDNTCVLTAETSADLTDGYACGFLYGKDEDNMQRVQVSPDGTKFNLTLESLDYETEYFYRAFVGNGRNEICSDIRHFRTLATEQAENSMILPFHTKEVGRLSSRFTVEVGGNADFSVAVPDEVDWLRCGTNGRSCIVFVETNDTEYSRSCDILFRNLSDDSCDTLTVYQQAADTSDSNLPYNDVVLPPIKVHTWITLLMDQDINVSPLDDGSEQAQWLRCSSVTNMPYGYSEVFFIAEENTTDQDRTARFIVSYDGYDSVISVTQKACNAIIEFEDPFVEIVLVDAFDMDGDGKLSYAEAAQIDIDDVKKIDFFGLDIRSFEELRYFTEIWHLQAPSFAGSKIERVRFPYGLSFIAAGLGTGLFENCTELKEIELNCIDVGTNTFRGCTGLKKIRAIVSGENAFAGCTGLETVEQQFSGVANQAFLNCTSLRTFEFRIKEVKESHIGYEAFRGCSSLPEISIPDVVGTIGDRAFYDCSSLTAVYMERFDPPIIGEDVFVGTNPDLKIYVHPESLSKYQDAWPSVAGKITANDYGGSEADSMVLPFHYISLNSWETEFIIEVGGNAEFDVDIATSDTSIPLTCRRDGRKCIFSLLENTTRYGRKWAVVFKNLHNGQCEVLNVYQKNITESEGNIPFNIKTIPFEGAQFKMSLNKDLFSDIRFIEDEFVGASEWVSWNIVQVGENVEICFDVSENTSLEYRYCFLLITYDGRKNYLMIEQKGSF